MNVVVGGLRRSGNHAVSNWLCHKMDGKVVFFNNCGCRRDISEMVGRRSSKEPMLALVFTAWETLVVYDFFLWTN